MEPVRAGVRDRQRGRLRELVIHADAVLNRPRNLHVGCEHDQARWLRDRWTARVRIGESGIADDVLDEATRLIVQQIGDRDRSAPIVERADAGADHIRLLRSRRVRHGRPGREVIRIAEVVLPVVPHAVRERDARTPLEVVLHVRADLLFEERQDPVAVLLDE